MAQSFLPQWMLNNDTAFTDMSAAEIMYILHNMNMTQMVDHTEFDILRLPVWKGLVLTLYIIIIFIGISGNSIVIYVVLRNRHMQNVTNILIANLAIADIGLCMFSLPIQLYYQITDQWIFGDALCRVIFAAFAVPMYGSVLTILLIAYDRYWLIVYPLKERMSVRVAIMLIIVTSILSVMLAVPVICFTYLQPIDHMDISIHRKYCVEEWPNQQSRKAYSIITFSFQFCLPLIVTGSLYSKIYHRLQHRPSSRRTAVDRKQKTNKILLAIVILFVICWLPWNVFTLLTELSPRIVQGAHYKFVDLLLKAFAMGSACINPFLYCWLNENFRKELSELAIRLHVYRRSSQQNSHHGHYQFQRTADNNSPIATDPYGTITDRFSTSARLSAATIL